MTGAQATIKVHAQQLEAVEQAKCRALREQRTKAEARKLAAVEEAEKDKEAALAFAEAELKQWQHRCGPAPSVGLLPPLGISHTQ